MKRPIALVLVLLMTLIALAPCGQATEPHTHEWKEYYKPYPNCTRTGMKYKYCRTCGASGGSVEVKALGHSYTLPWTTVKEPTCTEPGTEYNVCQREVADAAALTGGICGYEWYREIPALGHDWGEWHVVKQPTSAEDGYEERECARCHITEQRPIPATGEPESNYVKVTDTAYVGVEYENSFLFASLFPGVEYRFIGWDDANIHLLSYALHTSFGPSEYVKIYGTPSKTGVASNSYEIDVDGKTWTLEIEITVLESEVNKHYVKVTDTAYVGVEYENSFLFASLFPDAECRFNGWDDANIHLLSYALHTSFGPSKYVKIYGTPSKTGVASNSYEIDVDGETWTLEIEIKVLELEVKKHYVKVTDTAYVGVEYENSFLFASIFPGTEYGFNGWDDANIHLLSYALHTSFRPSEYVKIYGTPSRTGVASNTYEIDVDGETWMLEIELTILETEIKENSVKVADTAYVGVEYENSFLFASIFPGAEYRFNGWDDANIHLLSYALHTSFRPSEYVKIYGTPSSTGVASNTYEIDVDGEIWTLEIEITILEPDSPDDPGKDDYCKLTLTMIQDGCMDYEQYYCAEHWEALKDFYAAVEEAQTEEEKLAAWAEVRAAWTAEIDEMYASWSESANPEDSEMISDESSMFYSYLEGCEELYTVIYADDPVAAAEKLCAILANKCGEMCYELNVPGETRPDSRLDVYAISDGTAKAGNCTVTYDGGFAQTMHYTVSFCEEHAAIENAVNAGVKGLMTLEEREAAFKAGYRKWLTLLNSRINDQYVSADDAGKERIAAYRSAVNDYLDARKALLDAVYAENPMTAAEALMNETMREVVANCD